MLQLRNIDVGLNSLLIAFQMKAFILARAPEIVSSHGGHFKVSHSYVRRWCRDHLGWSFRKPTSMASKLPADWEQKGQLFKFCIAYLVYTWYVPQALVVNMDQTTVHFLPVRNERTYIARGSRDVSIVGRGDKRQVMVVVACSVGGDVLPFQVIF